MMELKDFKGLTGTALIASLLILFASYFLVFTRKSYSFKGKHCLITGGSSGLGKAIAAKLLEKGANITIIARNKELLREAKTALEGFKVSSKQSIDTISADVTNFAEMELATSKLGPVDALFSCAGSSKPGFFLEQSIDDFESGMKLNYFGTLNTAKLAVQSMIKNNVKDGRIVMISSTLGLMGMIGYSQYSPTKFAIRGLAECLRQELIPYGIKVSIYFVSTIKSPGYDKENLTKPAITKMIEDGDFSDPSPEARASTLIKGVEGDQFYITSDIFTDVFRVVSSGTAPWNNFILDPLYQIIGQLLLPFWRRYCDYLIKKEHHKAK